MSIKSKIKHNDIIMLIYDKFKELYYKYGITDEKLIRNKFIKRLNRSVELENPVNYNDKLQWLKLNWQDHKATECADKYEVRRFVREKIGERYLNQLIAVYDTADQVDITNLPERFILKATHGSGFNIICKDKNNMDWKNEIKKMKRWLRNNYYLQNRELIYKGIKPRIVCEKYIEQDDGDELRDYRFFCFNGEPKFITVDFSITDKSKTRRNVYDLNWNLMDVQITYPQEVAIKVMKPQKLDEMIELSRKLSSSFPHARVDFYYINNQIIFGEITFFHQSGMGKIIPEEFEIQMGEWLTLPRLTNKKL